MVGANEPSPLERAFLHVLRAYVTMGKVKLFTAPVSSRNFTRSLTATLRKIT